MNLRREENLLLIGMIAFLLPVLFKMNQLQNKLSNEDRIIIACGKSTPGRDSRSTPFSKEPGDNNPCTHMMGAAVLQSNSHGLKKKLLRETCDHC